MKRLPYSAPSGLRLLFCVLSALALALHQPLSAAAGGLIIRARPLGEAGLQGDVAFLSPRLSRLTAANGALGLAGWEAYTVQPGDTLTAIAARLGIPVAQLIEQNGLTNAGLIRAGLVLRTTARPALPPSLPAAGPLEQVRLWPWPPVQGQTLVIWLRASEALSYTLTLAGRSTPLTVDGMSAWALIPIAALEAPGEKPLVVAGLRPGPGAATAVSATVTLRAPVQPGVFETDQIPASASDPILSQADKVWAELVRLTALFGGFTPAGWTPVSRFQSPLQSDYPRTSPFGSRRTYGDDASLSAHTGEDYSAPAGAPVFAPAAGVVVLAEPLFVRGNAVVLDHGSGVFTGYWHLQAIHVRAGEQVKSGQPLGEVGSTGLSTGAHLHWELRVGGVAVDPLQWLESAP